MKKFVVLILALLYLSASVGATVHLHFCMNRLVDWGLWHNNDEKCGKCGMEKGQEKENGCCKDEHKQIKLESDHKGAVTYSLTELGSVALPVAVFELPDIKLPTVTEQNPQSHAPPRSWDIAVYIRNCVFRI
jgi:hypothetical protein